MDILSEGSRQTSFDDDVADNMRQLIINAFAKTDVDIDAVSFVDSPTVVCFEFIQKMRSATILLRDFTMIFHGLLMKSASHINGMCRVKALCRKQLSAFLKAKTLRMLSVSPSHSVEMLIQWPVLPAQ